jgi:hypothetical protein
VSAAACPDATRRMARIVRGANAQGRDPIALGQIQRAMGAGGANPALVRSCVARLAQEGRVVVLPGGVLWCPMGAGALRYEARRRWVKL